MTTAAIEIQKRFPLTNQFFDALAFLNPAVALSINKTAELVSLQSVWSKFISINGIHGNIVDQEWKNIAIYFSDIVEKETLLQLNVEEFWLTAVRAFESPMITLS